MTPNAPATEESYCLAGLEALRRGDLGNAQLFLKRALATEPSSDAAVGAWCELLANARAWPSLTFWSGRRGALGLHPEALFHRALGLLREDAYEEALIDLKRVVALVPAGVAPWALIADAEERAGRNDAALHGHDRAAALAPGDATIASRLIDRLLETGNVGDAIARFAGRLATLEAPVDLLAAFLRPPLATALGDSLAALSLAIARRWPERPEAGDWLLQAAASSLARRDDAKVRAAMRSAAALAPGHGPIWSNLSDTTGYRDPARAVAFAERAVALSPLQPEAHGALALAYRALLRLDAAEAPLRRALAITPDYLSAFVNLTQLLLLDGRLTEAEAQARRARAIAPNRHLIALNLGHALLAAGKLDAGLPLYEERLIEDGDPPRVQTRLHRPRWNGEPLDGRTLLIWAELGIGDHFLFARWLPMVSRMGGRVIVECDRRVLALYRRSFPVLSFVPLETTVEEILQQTRVDLQIPVGSLPLAFVKPTRQIVERRRAGVAPSLEPYFKPDPAKAASWEQILSERHGRLRVAVSWRSGMRSWTNAFQVMTASQLAGALRGLPITVVNVQYDSEPAEIETMREALPDFYEPPIDLKNDLEDVTALLSRCDLLISSITAVNQIGGAIGIPTWCFFTGRNWVTMCFDQHPMMPNLAYFSRRIGESWEKVAQRIRSELVRVLETPASAGLSPHLPRVR